MDVLDRAELGFPKSLPEFQEFFPDDAACASYLEKARWPNGFTCPHCQKTGEPSRIKARPTVLTCRKCRRQSALMSGTVMERSHTPLSTWFWAAYLFTSQTNGMSAAQPAASPSLSQRVHLQVQPPLLPLQCLPLVARHRSGGFLTHAQRALLR